MSVIGRLDEQTEAILITPLEKRSRTDTNNGPPDDRTHDEAQPSSDSKRITPRAGRSSRDDSQPPGELPVWLL